METQPILLIDADSIVYILSWVHRENTDDKESVIMACNSMLKDMLTFCGTHAYIGVFSDKICFRHTVYKYAPYKGNRKEKEDYVIRWEPIIKEHFTKNFGFITIPELEADDVVNALSELIDNCIVASPDKDLRQSPGTFFDYKSTSWELVTVSKDKAHENFWVQMLTGDSTDNVIGIPGIGEVKAEKLLKSHESIYWPNKVKLIYMGYFGSHYGSIIFTETLHTLQLLGTSHPMLLKYSPQIQTISVQYFKVQESIFNTNHE